MHGQQNVKKSTIVVSLNHSRHVAQHAKQLISSTTGRSRYETKTCYWKRQPKSRGFHHSIRSTFLRKKKKRFTFLWQTNWYALLGYLTASLFLSTVDSWHYPGPAPPAMQLLLRNYSVWGRSEKMRKKQDGKQGQEEDCSDTTVSLYSLIPSFTPSVPTKGLIL